MSTPLVSSWFWKGSSVTSSAKSSTIRIVPAEESNALPRINVVVKNAIADVVAFFEWVGKNIKIQPAKKRLRVCESVSLGEKRFIAVVQIDGQEFLVGGAPNSLSLLASVDKATTTFSEILTKSYGWDRKQG